jgi:hypothetical protein
MSNAELDLAHELWAMAQSPAPVEDVVGLIAAELKKFAAAEVAKERERCKEIASKYSMRSGIGDDGVAAAEAIEQEIASEPSAQK